MYSNYYIIIYIYIFIIIIILHNDDFGKFYVGEYANNTLPFYIYVYIHIFRAFLST